MAERYGPIDIASMRAAPVGSLLVKDASGLWVAGTPGELGGIPDADFATFDPLPAVTAGGGPGVGKTLTADVAGPLSMDGASPTAGQSVLIGGQANPNDNGVYDVTDAGNGGVFILTRRTDSDELLAAGYQINVRSGTEFVNSSWRVIGAATTDPDVTSWTWEPANATWRVVTDTIVADQDDYGPPNWKTVALLQIDGGVANRDITGLNAAFSHRIYKSSGFGFPVLLFSRITLMNFGTTNNLVLKDNDNGANSLVVNEFRFPLGIDHVLLPGDSIDLMYQGQPGALFWRPI